MEIAHMGKTELRAACRDAKVKGFSKLTVAAMRTALTALAKPAAPVVKDKKPRAARPEQNGVTQPGEGTKCRAVWDWCDKFKKDTGSAPDAAAAREHAEKAGWNVNNTLIETSQWKRFHGLSKPRKAAS